MTDDMGDGASPAERLQLALRLESMGQTQSAIAALLPALTDRSVRASVASHPNLRHFAARPAWSHREGTSGRNRFVPVGAVSRPPLVRWSRSIENSGAHTILASPLGIVCASSRCWLVLDPATGATIFEVQGRPFPADPAIVGDVLLSVTFTDRLVIAHDLWTGRELWKLGKPVKSFFAGDGWLETLWDAKVRDRFDVGDPAKQPAASSRFPLGVSAIAGGVFYARDAAGTRAHSRDRQWTIPGAVSLADDSSAVALGRAECSLHQGEREVWKAPCPGEPVALLPEGVVVLDGGRDLALLERHSGQRRPLPVSLVDQGTRQSLVLSAARGAFYVQEKPGEVLSVSPDGEIAWRFAMAEVAAGKDRTITSLVPASGLLFGNLKGGTVFCLEERADF
jgi:hypothetical protein